MYLSKKKALLTGKKEKKKELKEEKGKINRRKKGKQRKRKKGRKGSKKLYILYVSNSKHSCKLKILQNLIK